MPKQTSKRTVKKKPSLTRRQQPSLTRSIAAAYSHESKTRELKERPYIQTEEVLNVTGVKDDFAVIGNIVCQPGLDASFPWLSGHAQLYEKYYVNYITYRFKGIRGSSYAGKVMMSFDYDTLDAPPGNSIEVSGMTTYISGSPWSQFELKVKTDGRKLFTRKGDVPATGDPKSYDMGRLYVSCFGCEGKDVLGTVEVSYNISLMDKQPKSNIPVVMQTTVRHARVSHSTLQNFTSGVEAKITFANPTIDTIGIVVDLGTDLILPPGIYLIMPSVTVDINKFEICELKVENTTRIYLADANNIGGEGSLVPDTTYSNSYIYSSGVNFTVYMTATTQNGVAGVIPSWFTAIDIVQLG